MTLTAAGNLIALICDAVPMACVVADAESLRIRCGNDAAEALTSRTLADLADAGLQSLSTDKPQWPGMDGTAIAVGDEAELEFQLTRPGEDEIWVTACTRAVDVAGETLLVVVLNDVEERRQLEDSLADTAVELAMTSGFPEMNPGPVYRLDKRGSVILANAPARLVFGRDRVEGRSWLELCPGMTDEFWRSVLESNDAVALEAQVDREAYVFTHTYDREHDYVFVHGTDLTRQRAAEQALRESERMAAVGTLAAGIAHEMNNPSAAAQRCAEQLGAVVRQFAATQMNIQKLNLTPDQRERMDAIDRRMQALPGADILADAAMLSGMEAEIEDWLEDAGIEEAWTIAADLAESRLTPADLDEMREGFGGESLPHLLPWVAETYLIYSLADEIRNCSNRVAGLVATLKDYTYLDQAPVQSVNVGAGLEQATELMQSRIGPGVEVVCEFDPDLPSIDAYGGELNQVWSHLIANALDALNGQGRLILRAMGSEEGVRVEVEDNGTGIAADIQARVFDPFFTTRPPGGGQGLGLTTSQNIIVEKHRGTIELESVPGRTVFSVKLPRRLAISTDT